MSKRMIVLEIDCEEEKCGKCSYPFTQKFMAHPPCRWSDGNGSRGPECLAAERKLRDLVKAGNELYTWCDNNYLSEAWVEALNAMDGDE